MAGIALEINRKCKVCGKVFRVKKLDSPDFVTQKTLIL